MLEEKREKWWREMGRGSNAHGAFKQLTAEEKGGGYGGGGEGDYIPIATLSPPE